MNRYKWPRVIAFMIIVNEIMVHIREQSGDCPLHEERLEVTSTLMSLAWKLSTPIERSQVSSKDLKGQIGLAPSNDSAGYKS